MFDGLLLIKGITEDGRRLKGVCVPALVVLEMFTQPRSRITLANIGGLPKDYELKGVSWSDECQSFVFYVWSSEFYPVPLNQQIPMFGGDAGLMWGRFKVVEDGELLQ